MSAKISDRYVGSIVFAATVFLAINMLFVPFSYAENYLDIGFMGAGKVVQVNYLADIGDYSGYTNIQFVHKLPDDSEVVIEEDTHRLEGSNTVELVEKGVHELRLQLQSWDGDYYVNRYTITNPTYEIWGKPYGEFVVDLEGTNIPVAIGYKSSAFYHTGPDMGYWTTLELPEGSTLTIKNANVEQGLWTYHYLSNITMAADAVLNIENCTWNSGRFRCEDELPGGILSVKDTHLTVTSRENPHSVLCSNLTEATFDNCIQDKMAGHTVEGPEMWDVTKVNIRNCPNVYAVSFFGIDEITVDNSYMPIVKVGYDFNYYVQDAPNVVITNPVNKLTVTKSTVENAMILADNYSFSGSHVYASLYNSPSTAGKINNCVCGLGIYMDPQMGSNSAPKINFPTLSGCWIQGLTSGNKVTQHSQLMDYFGTTFLPISGNYWGGFNGPTFEDRTGWLGGFGTYVPYFKGYYASDPDKECWEVRPPEDRYNWNSTFSYFHPPAKTNHWYEGLSVGGRTVQGSRVTSVARNDKDVLICYDIRPKGGMSEIRGLSFKLKDTDKGTWYNPEKQLSAVKADYGDPDNYKRTPNDRTLNFIIPALPGRSNLHYQLWVDLSGMQFYKPNEFMTTNFFPLDKDPYTLTYRGKYKENLRLAIAPIALNYWGKTNRVSSGAVSELKEQLVNDMVCMLPISEDEITFIDWVDSDKYPYFTLKCKASGPYFIKQIVSTKLAYYYRKYNLFSWAKNEIDAVIAILPKGSLGGDGAVMGLRGTVCMVEEGAEEAALHELGHAFGLYTGTEQYNYPSWPFKKYYDGRGYDNDGKGNFIDPQSGAPIRGATAFIAEKGRTHTFQHAKNRIQHYPSFSPVMAIRKKRMGYLAWDVMGTVKPKWMIETTYSSFVSKLDALLGGYETRAARSDSISNGYMRILLSSPLDQDDSGRPIVDRTTLQCELTPTNVAPYVADHYAGIYSNNHVGFFNAANDRGEPLLDEFDYPEYCYRGKYQTQLFDTFMQTFDVPTNAAEYIFYSHEIYNDQGSRDPKEERRFTKANSIAVSLAASSSTFSSNVTLTKTVQAPAAHGMPVHLTSRLYYSTNNGTEWIQWGHWKTDEPLTVFTDFLPVGNSLAFMLEVNDGFQTASNVVRNLTKLNQAPIAQIDQPHLGAQSVTGTVWQISALVFDPDGGEVTNVTWTSSIDGELGRAATLRDVVLSSGTHILTFEATDAAGASSSTSRTVQVTAPDSIGMVLPSDALAVDNGITDPVEQQHTGLLRGRTNRVVFTISNQGITNDAEFAVWYTPGNGVETNIISTQISWDPLETIIQLVDIPVSTTTAHTVRARLTSIDPGATKTNNVQQIWAFTNHPPIVQPLQVYGFQNDTNRWMFSGWDADGDTLTYEVVTPAHKGRVFVTGEAFIYLVTNGFGEDTFSYRASDGLAYSEAQTVDVEIPAPIVTGISAADSQSTGQIEVVWNAVPGATGYEVFRNTATNPVIYGSVSLGTVTTSAFTDTTAQPSNMYYYSVRALCGNATGELGRGDFGYLSVVPPPYNLSTHPSSSTNWISIWFQSPIFMRYGYIYRSTSNDFNTKEYLGRTAISTEMYTDKTVVPGYTYYYWITITDGDNNYSPFAGPVTGKYSGVAADPPAAPTGVKASLGTYSEYVKVTWNPVAGVDSYVVMRVVTNSAAPSPAGNSVIGITNTAFFHDKTADTQARYAYRDYWVAAVKDGLYSKVSGPSMGYRSVVGPASNVVASQKQHINQVVLNWLPASYRGFSRRYEIWRSPDTNLANAVLLDTIYTTGYTNEVKGYGTYYYFIRAVTGDMYYPGPYWRTDGYGPFSDPIPGQPYYDPDNQEFAALIINADPFDNIATYADVRDGDDFDGDGQSNIEERYANTDPIDADSLFAMDMRRENNTLVFMWPSVPGRSYRVESATNLNSGYSTLSIATNYAIPYGFFTNQILGADAARFFRVLLD